MIGEKHVLLEFLNAINLEILQPYIGQNGPSVNFLSLHLILFLRCIVSDEQPVVFYVLLTMQLEKIIISSR
jgi:hypothetical protein